MRSTPAAEQRGDLLHGCAGGDGDEVRVGCVHGERTEVGRGLGNQPAAHVAVAEGAAHGAVLVDEEHHPGLVLGDAAQGIEDRGLHVHRVGRGMAIEDHVVLHPSRVSMLSAAATSVRVSMSTPSTSSRTNSPVRPPMRFSWVR